MRKNTIIICFINVAKLFNFIRFLLYIFLLINNCPLKGAYCKYIDVFACYRYWLVSLHYQCLIMKNNKKKSRKIKIESTTVYVFYFFLCSVNGV